MRFALYAAGIIYVTRIFLPLLLLIVAAAPAAAQRDRQVGRNQNAAAGLRAARTIYIEPSEDIDSKYLEYKLNRFPDFERWNLSIVRDTSRADLVLNVHNRLLHYIFSIEAPNSGIVVVTGKVLAINDLVAAEDMSVEIIKRMRDVRALPASDGN